MLTVDLIGKLVSPDGVRGQRRPVRGFDAVTKARPEICGRFRRPSSLGALRHGFPLDKRSAEAQLYSFSARAGAYPSADGFECRIAVEYRSTSEHASPRLLPRPVFRRGLFGCPLYTFLPRLHRPPGDLRLPRVGAPGRAFL